MQLPPKRLEILILLWLYWVLRCAQIRDRLLPHDRDGSITRGHLRRLIAEGLARRYEPRIVDPLGAGNAPPVYALTLKGSSVLAAITGNAGYLRKAEVSFSNWMSVNHWCSVAGLAMIIDDAFAAEKDARLLSRHSEQEVADPEGKCPSDKYFLHSKVGDKLFFVPDYAIETAYHGHVRVSFYEYETGANTPMRVAHKKHKGISGYFSDNHLREMFPSARDGRVIFCCPNAGWRDQLRKEFRNKGVTKWTLFCATPDVTPATFLRSPMLYTVDKGPFPFLPAAPGGSPVEEEQPEPVTERT